ncbi:MAG TPA: type II toxin-antitoxin system VapC family toxin [Phycisphaerae bacterium]|nr:type II toxin-antitoxin system VapC family toxin [Phycisphaerae bacterium]
MILVDTNLLVRAIEAGDKHQKPAVDALFLLRSRGEVPVLVPQNILEFYAVCTRSSRGPRLSADQVLLEVEKLKRDFPVLPESPAVFAQWETLVSNYKPVNRLVFDIRLAASMIVHGISTILTFNDGDFRSIQEIRTLNPFDLLNMPRV